MKLDRHIVSYSAYCPKCKHSEKDGWEDPCNECLTHPQNFGTREPIKFEEKKEYGSNARKVNNGEKSK